MMLHSYRTRGTSLPTGMRRWLPLGVAVGTLATATALSPALAFSTQTINAGSLDGSSRYTDSQQSPGSSNGYQPLGANGPTVQFNGGMRQISPFGPRFVAPPAASQYNTNNDND